MSAASGARWAALLLSAVLLWHFHDRFWWPVDEGVYGYVAQRMLAGDRPHLDLIDLHAGYGNWINAAALRVFGEDLLSLRYPLAAATLAQAALVGWLLRRESGAVQAAGVVAMTAFSAIQFMNPSANWYALALAVATIAALSSLSPTRPRDLVIVGVLLGLCFLVRQLSGVILGIGAVGWLLAQQPVAAKGGWAGRGLALVMLAGLGGYLLGRESAVALIAFGIGPLGLLALLLIGPSREGRAVGRLVGCLALGGVIAALPLVAKHLAAGSLAAWLDDILVTALSIDAMPFIRQASFAPLAELGALNALRWEAPVAALNGLWWVAILLATPALGAAVLTRALREGVGAVPPLAFVASAYAVVSVHYQIPIYLAFSLPLTLVALLRMWPRPAMATALMAASAVAVVFHAGQPVSRGLLGMVEGRRVPLDSVAPLPRATLRMEEAERAVFAALIDRIADVARPDEPLATLPMEPELNFMTARPAPVRWYGSSLGLRSQADVTDAVDRIEAAAPMWLVHRRQDKYLTPLSAELLDLLRARAGAPEPFGPFDLYRIRGD